MFRRLGVVGAGAVLLFAMSPAVAHADNGPHVKGASLTTDGCAGCHRAHTAPNAMLLKTPETALCYTCHAGTGATTNVKDGVLLANTTGGARTGSLRGGGFTNSEVGTASWATRPTGTPIINPLGATAATTSSHTVDGVTTGTIWGNGAISSTNNYGATGVAMRCGTCHDPHGNGNYRILRPVPGSDVNGYSNTSYSISGISVFVPTVSGTNTGNRVAEITLSAAHNIITGNKVTIAGSSITSLNTTLAVVWVPVTLSDPANHESAKVPPTKIWVSTSEADGTTGTATGTVVRADPTIPDSTGAKTYSTADYWSVDDADTTAVKTATQWYSSRTGVTTTGATQTAFIQNVSAWCSTCHTRYAAQGGSYDVNSGDSVFTYRHTGVQYYLSSATSKVRNCIQCHVAHGSSVAMTSGGPADGATGHAGENPGQAAGATNAHPGKLLRADNRATCQFCHNK